MRACYKCGCVSCVVCLFNVLVYCWCVKASEVERSLNFVKEVVIGNATEVFMDVAELC